MAIRDRLLIDGVCACVVEISKTLEMQLFLFDDILLLTKVKKMSRKVGQAVLYTDNVIAYL